MTVILFSMMIISIKDMMMKIIMIFIIMSLMLFSSIDVFMYKVSILYFWDILSISMIFLTLLIVMICIMTKLKMYNNYTFYFLVSSLNLMLIISFSMDNLILFYLWFESSLIPIYLMIIGWGYQPERMSASLYLLFYTLVGSMPLLISILMIYQQNFSSYMRLQLEGYTNLFLMTLMIAFFIKTPMFMVHSWLPKAHVEAPTIGSMILAALMLKLGNYGLLRIMYMMKMNMDMVNFLIMGFILLSSIMISLICLMQMDIKSLIAYSSVAHMSLVMLSFFTNSSMSMMGIIFIMVGHGMCSSGMFYLAGTMYERSMSRSFNMNKSQNSLFPFMILFWFLMCSSNMASPPSMNLMGELNIMFTIIYWNKYTILLMFLIFLLIVIYSIYLYSRLFHGSLKNSLLMLIPSNLKEMLVCTMHWMPLNLMFLLTTLSY
uniref:NADH-ubiquinone oxidoreductase chain 4 n=1 Tax=Arisubathynella cheongmiensis TaxID=2025387 RepID=A0A7R6D8Q6_9CRUS|nr:NADH dehydrogenase subunit 4 [Arisubathynella cheongmiensis]